MRDDAAAVLDAAKQRAAYVDGNTNGSLRWLDQRLQDPDVVVIGDTAILTAVVVDTIERTRGADEFRLRLTMTWVRQDEAWRCLAGHAGPAVSGP
jgi:ketosteroid isomerase-like protein